MAWQIELTQTAKKSLAKIDKNAAKKIIVFLRDIAALDNPLVKGKALTGNLTGYWRYRMGDYRIVCNVSQQEITILVVRIGHRKDIYKK